MLPHIIFAAAVAASAATAYAAAEARAMRGQMPRQRRSLLLPLLSWLRDAAG
jgi:hypothetical protein